MTDESERVAVDPGVLSKVRADLRREIGDQPSAKGDGWQPMVAAREVRVLLDALDAAEAKVERLRATELDAAAHRYCLEAISLSPAPEATTSEAIYWLTERLSQALSRAEEAEAKVARGRALADEAERGEGIVITPGFTTVHAVEVGRLRAALADAPVESARNG